jgi:hypothetical protein
VRYGAVARSMSTSTSSKACITSSTSRRATFDLRALGFNALLLGAHDLIGDAPLVVELEQLLLLAVEFADATLVTLGFAASDLGICLDMAVESLADGALLGGGEQQGLVLVLDSELDLVQPDVGSITAPRLGHAAQAGVVLVVLARATAVAAVSKALAADPTEQRTGQIVGVLVRAVAASAMGVQNALGLIEGLPVDDRLMASGALDALAGDDADVVVVPEHPVNHAARERGARSLGSTSRTQSCLFQDFRDRREGVRAGCGEVEGQSDVADTVVISGD